MILRNFYNLLAMGMMGWHTSDTSTFGDGHLNVKSAPGGNIRGITALALNLGRIGGIVSGISESYSRIGFGSGNTAVTFDDYTLSNIISSSVLSASAIQIGSPAYTSGSKKWTNAVTMVLTNNSSAAITVSEVGLYVSLINGSASGYEGYAALVYREVLDTPFTIAAGESVNYTHNFEFTMPTV